MRAIALIYESKYSTLVKRGWSEAENVNVFLNIPLAADQKCKCSPRLTLFLCGACVRVCVCVCGGASEKKPLLVFKKFMLCHFFFSTPFSCFSKVAFHFPFYSCKKEQEPCVCESCPVASIQIFMNLIFIMSWLRNPWKLALYLPCVGLCCWNSEALHRTEHADDWCSEIEAVCVYVCVFTCGVQRAVLS